MKRNRSRPEIIVGIFGILTFLAIVYMSREVGDAPFVKAKGVGYNAYFDAVTGLIPKSPVEIAGIQVGFVESINLENARARLVVKVDPKIPIYEDAVISIRSRGILGDHFVAIQPGTTGKRILRDGDLINSAAQGGELGSLMDTMQEAATNMRDLTKTVNAIIQEQNEKRSFQRIFENVDNMTTRLNDLIEGNAESMQAIVENMRDVSVSLKAFVDSNVNERLTESSIRLEKTLTAMQQIVEKVNRGEGTVGKLINDDTTVEKLNAALTGVEKFTSGIGKLQTEIGYRGEYLTQSQGLQNMVGLTIRPRPDKYFRLQVVSSPIGDTSVTETTVSSPPGNVISTTETVETTDRVQFSIEMAKRFYDATFRFGIIRNEGGVGLDYSFFDDMLELSVEGFDFSRYQNRFHLRSYATLNLFEHLMLTGGVDDIMNETGDIDPFIGAGLSFRDDDIRTLFGTLSFSRF